MTKRDQAFWDAITITDDLMFKTVLSDPEICRQFLEVLLGIEILKVVFVNAEHWLGTPEDVRTIRLDVYVNDEAGTIYNIEMQNENKGDLPPRTRFHHARLAYDSLGRGDDFDDLAPVFVIFMCAFDPFGQGLPVYRFENRCADAGGLPLNDGAVTIFACAPNYAEAEEPGLRSLLRYFEDQTVTDELSSKMQEEVVFHRNEAAWRSRYMLVAEKMEQERKQGIKQGYVEFSVALSRLWTEDPEKAGELLGKSPEEQERCLRDLGYLPEE